LSKKILKEKNNLKYKQYTIKSQILSSHFLLSNFRSKVKFHLTFFICQWKIHHQWSLIWHIQGYLGWKWPCFWKKVEVSGCETQCHWFLDIKHYCVFISSVFLSQNSVSWADVPCDRKPDLFFVGLNPDSFGQAAKLSAYSTKLVWRHGDDGCEFSLWNTQILGIQIQ
jgi:hypothetical protein